MRHYFQKKFILLFFILILLFTSIFSQQDYTRIEKNLFQRFVIANKFFEKGKKYFLKKKLNKAERELEKCIQKMPEHADAYFFLSQISYQKGDYPIALDYMLKAKKNFKFLAKLKVNAQQQYIIQLQEIKRNLEERLLLLKEQLGKTSNPEEKSSLEAEIGKVEGEIGTINNRLNRPLPEIEQIPADYFYFHGNILFKLKKYQEAHDQYIKTIELDPKHAYAYNNLALLYYMAKNYQRALDYLNQAEVNGVKVNQKLKKTILDALKK